MKKYLMVSFLGVFVVAFCSSDTFARQHYSHAPDHYINLSFFVFHPASVGYKQILTHNIYLTGNMDYERSDKDLVFQAGAAYMIPRKILFFRLYGGGGVELSRNHGYMYPYVSVGTNFWILYTEMVHPLQSKEEPSYRFGFSFSF